MDSMRYLLLPALLFVSASSPAQLKAVPYLTGLTSPMDMVQDPTRPDTRYIVERGGIIKVAQGSSILPTRFLDISTLTSTDNERGLLSMALSPDYKTSGFAYVYYTDLASNIQIKRYTRSNANPLVLDPSTVHDVITIPHFGYPAHCGGTVAFGPDGYMYAAVGDPGGLLVNYPQSPTLLVGKMIRIDPSGDDFPADTTRNYAIPTTNPFANGHGIIAALPEIWAFGYRNPFRFSFDDPAVGGNGGLIVGDVGQGRLEEIDYEPLGRGGRNYGWPRFEGSYDIHLPVAYEPLTGPVYEYLHTVDASGAITGGRIYRGSGLGPRFYGRYFFGDSVRRSISSLQLTYDTDGEAHSSDLQNHKSELKPDLIVSFAADTEGELYFVNLISGTINKIVPNDVVLTGTVLLGDFNGPLTESEVVVQVRTAGSDQILDSYTVTPGRTGGFTVGTERSGVYDVAVKGSHWLRKVIHNVSFGPTGANIISPELLNGDVNGDNLVSSDDLIDLQHAFGSMPGSPNWNPAADLNGDHVVSLADVGIFRRHYNQTGEH